MIIHLRTASILALLVAVVVAAAVVQTATTTRASAIVANGPTTAMPRLISTHARAIVVEGPDGESAVYGSDGRPVWSRPMTWPTEGPATSEFGWRSGRIHKGIDIGAETGAPIVAARSGRVLFSSWKGGYGNTVDIDHGGGVVTRYAHLTETLVSRGERVAQGALIGMVGMTGSATGPHLHFEVRVNDHPRDPRTLLG